jgi:hypothetical protein
MDEADKAAIKQTIERLEKEERFLLASLDPAVIGEISNALAHLETLIQELQESINGLSRDDEWTSP